MDHESNKQIFNSLQAEAGKRERWHGTGLPGPIRRRDTKLFSFEELPGTGRPLGYQQRLWKKEYPAGKRDQRIS